MIAYRLLAVFMVSAIIVLTLPLGTLAKGGSSISAINVPVGQSIQEAINNAAEGDTIIIQNGVHIYNREQYPIFVNKSVTLLGENIEQTIIDGNGTFKGIFNVNASDSKIIGLTVQNTSSSGGVSGISLADVVNVDIVNCTITKCQTGILLWNATYGNITMNRIVNNLGYGIWGRAASCFNKVVGNNITDSPIGVLIPDMNCQNNLFYYNNFINNAFQQDDKGFNSWNGTYPVGGNYWSDHTNVDLMNGVNQNVLGSDGIADSAYHDLDWYPLVEPTYFYRMGSWNGQDYYTAVASNSTVVSFRFDPGLGVFVNFSVVGDDGTTGCCRVAIPRDVLWVDSPVQWTIVINDTALTADDPLIVENSRNTYFYFTYDHSTQAIRIIGTHAIPELPSVLWLALLAVFSGALLLRRRVKSSFRGCG